MFAEKHSWTNCQIYKDAIKKAHRKIMLLNHPDRGGSPYIATKINEAHECLAGRLDGDSEPRAICSYSTQAMLVQPVLIQPA